MSEIYAVLLEVASIQRYVFGSNKLKENYGASYLVENVFEDNLKTAWKNIGFQAKDFELWANWAKDEDATDDFADEIRILKPDIEAEVGYIGGGNALLFFIDQEKARNLAKEWSKELLLNTPGLNPTIAIGKIDSEDLIKKEKYSETITNLFKKLAENKLRYQPQTILPRHGITAECNRTGLSAECLDKTIKDKEFYISSVASAKLKAAREANRKLLDDFREILKNHIEEIKKDNNNFFEDSDKAPQYHIFPDEFEELGQSEDDSHISIVHIDGNRMGVRFQKCETLSDSRKLSKSVKNATKNSMGELLKTIIEKIDDSRFNDYVNYKSRILPIRPIIIGGDDITFVCPGKLGVYFAKIFMENFSKKEVSDGKKLSSCTGVAITKTKYPFYRGYKLAEKLCGSAKEDSRKEENSSWLDFHLSYGGFSGTLEDIRDRNYVGVAGRLCLRPYRVITGDIEKIDCRDFSECINGIKHLKGIDGNSESEDKWPNSKLKELREVLTMGISSAKIFIQEMEFRDKTLPDIIANPLCKKTGWMSTGEDAVTPYFDMLELMEIYPINLEEKGVNDVEL